MESSLRPLLLVALYAAIVAGCAWMWPPAPNGHSLAVAHAGTTAAEPTPGQLARLAALDDGPEGRAARRALRDGGPLPPAAQAALRELLDRPDPTARRAALRALWGVEMGPSLATQVVALTRSASDRQDALSLALCPMPSKTGDAVDALLAATDDPDPAIRQRAWWGLSFGVPAAQSGAVADHVLSRWEPDASVPAQFAWLIVLLDCAQMRHIDAITSLTEDTRLTESVRKYARFCERRVRQRSAE